MIIQALSKYYDILKNNNIEGIPDLGFSRIKISFEAILNDNGELIQIIPILIKGENNKRNIKIAMVPQQQKRASNICPNFLYDNPSYCFGFYSVEKDKDDALKKFEAFKKLHLDLLKDINDEQIKIFLSFLNKFHFDMENKLFSSLREGLESGGNVVFRIKEKYLHDNPLALKEWVKYKQELEKNFLHGQCAVSGQIKPIAILHPSIKGILDAQSSGASIVSYNCDSFESYNKKQGANSSISEEITFKYTTILNYLLEGGSKQKIQIGDATTVFWAETSNPQVNDLMRYFLKSPKSNKEEADSELEKSLLHIFENIKAGKKISDELSIDENTKFFILGLSPNASRIAIRFFYANTIQKIIDNFLLHLKDFEIDSGNYYQIRSISNDMILTELINPKTTKEKINPLLSGSFMRAVLTGSMYPRVLFSTVMKRINKDHDEKNSNFIKINPTRVAIIKAYLTRYYRFNKNDKRKEELSVSLNQNSNDTAYLIGRLFATLEKAQRDVNPDIGATIKDRYFSSACATPSVVFPTLLKLAQSHIAKLDHGIFFDKKISEIMDKLQEPKFPKHLDLDSQGIFIIGYYHQMNYFYKKNEQKGEIVNE